MQVTIVPGPRDAAVRRQLRRIGVVARSRAAIALVAAVLGVGLASAIAAGVWPGGGPGGLGGGSGGPAGSSQLSQRGAALAAIYRYPLGCLSVTMSVAQSAKLARQRHAGPCWRYGVFITAILHRVAGEWRLMLEATSPSCPTVSLPPAIESQVAICRRPGRNG